MKNNQEYMGSEIADILLLAAQTASEEIKNLYYANENGFEEKESHKDIVTIADKNSQKIIHDLLLEKTQAIGILANKIGFIEEESSQDSPADHTFIVDPLDGTSNFSSGLSFFCISIAYAYKMDVKVGIVFNPLTGEYFISQKGEGVWHVKKQGMPKVEIEKIDRKILKNSLISAHLASLTTPSTFACYEKLHTKCRGQRDLGAVALELCYLATDAFGAVICRGCKIWDIAAARLFLNEVGLEIFDVSGEVLEYDWQDTKKKYEILAASESNKNEILLVCNL